jgi:signal peptide peptidase SppA
MRQQEFDSMLMVAARKNEALEKIAAEIMASEVSADRDIKPGAMTTKRGERLMNTRYVEMREGSVAVIDVNGRLAKRMDLFTEVCEGGTSTENLLKDFQTCLDNPNVSSIVFNIDSPGGEAFGINEISQHIFAARGKKPIKAYVSGLGCSGAYWIASACEEIVCDKSAFLGSIGVVSVWIDDTEAYKMLGFDKKVVVSSNAPKKRLDLNKPEDMAEFVSELDSMEKVFIGAVARNRQKKAAEVINDFNQGGVLAGNEAVRVGMADRVGSLEGVIAELKKKPRANAMSAEKTGEKSMSFTEKFNNFLVENGWKQAKDEAPNGEPEAVAAAVAAESSTSAASPAGVSTVSDAEKAELLRQRESLLGEKAKSFAAAEVAANRLTPGEQPHFESAYLQALLDDAASPLAEGKTRAGLIESVQSKRAPHLFTAEKIAPDATFKVLNGDATAEEQLDADVEAQADAYVGTVNPKFKVVKN